MRRGEAVKRWGVIAAGGDLDAETRAWLADVAKALLLANDETVTNDKRMAISRAVGFSGQVDATLHLAIRQLAAEIKDPLLLRQCVRLVRDGTLLNGKTSDKAIDLQIKRAREANNAAPEK